VNKRIHEAAVWRGVSSEGRALIEKVNAASRHRRATLDLADAIQAEIPDSDIEERDIVVLQAEAIIARMEASGWRLDEGQPLP
jgi:hypothetical protein